jgi:hypothetical protein
LKADVGWKSSNGEMVPGETVKERKKRKGWWKKSSSKKKERGSRGQGRTTPAPLRI